MHGLMMIASAASRATPATGGASDLPTCGKCSWKIAGSRQQTCGAYAFDEGLWYPDLYGMDNSEAGADGAACTARAQPLADWCVRNVADIEMHYVPPCVGVQGDPTTVFNSEASRYWLNTEHFTPVFEQGPVILTQLPGPANPPPGLETSKGAWVVAMEVQVAGGLDTIRIETVNPTTLLPQPNATAPAASAAGALTTMRLAMGGKPLPAGAHTPSKSDPTVTVNAYRAVGRAAKLAIGSGYVDVVDIKAEGLHVRVMTSKANRYADEKLQVLGLHLDIEFVDFDEAAARGALPEMWGLRPMSNSTKLLVDAKSVDS